MDTFKALVVDKQNDDFSIGFKQLTVADLPEGDVRIKVLYSSVNFKDGLASIPNGKVVRSYPFVPGIDIGGIVTSSENPRFREGDEVIATSYDIGVSHYGGFSEIAQVPSEWVVPLPTGLTLEEAMTLGTAGFTAALSVLRLEENGLSYDKGPVLVTGATGGVGSIAVSILAKRGYHVVASTGKNSQRDYLHNIGATDIIHRDEVYGEKIKPMDTQLWAGAVDPVGGKTLAAVLSKIHYGGSVAVSGLTGGADVATTVFPFILRGVNLLGIDSVYCPMDIREVLWERMGADLKPNTLDLIKQVVPFDELPAALGKILKGESLGRMVVKISNE
ncbi:acryloyl-CoA reductase [Bacillus sp. HMF5848]|nr:acryloyl-CoA reductase [Bacillus sp. HMF5848]RSK25797.1 acryloyl-CoA reductase [Bacillus sp. HMF5848]